MKYFWETTDTIPDGFGFSHYDGLHLIWLAAFVMLTLACCIAYRKMAENHRKLWRWIVAGLLLCDELFKVIPMVIQGYFRPDYLPLHLCSVNIFLIAFHAWKPTKTVGNFLYTVCIPGAVAALLFPTWTSLPAANYMLIHSFTVHLLLAMYPIVLTVGGDIRPNIRELPKTMALLVALGLIALVANLLLDTNFMFLMSADPGNPLYLFEELWGSHLLGYPVLVTAVILVMHTPWLIINKRRNKVTV